MHTSSRQPMVHKVKTATLLMALMSMTSPSDASILNFTDFSNTVGDVPQDYGDRIVATIDPVTGYQNDLGNGFTPNVTADYRVISGSPINVWGGGYGDLVDAAGNGEYETEAEVVLTPDLGFYVQLNSFDVASWLAASTGIIRVLDGLDAVLFDSGPTLVPGDPGDGHWSYLGPPIRSQNSLRIIFRNETDTGGFWGTYALDNVNFD